MVIARNQVLVDNVFSPQAREVRRPEPVRRLQRRAARKPHLADSILLAATSIVLLVVILSSVYAGVSHAIRAAVYYDTQTAPTVSVTVKPGDTLWQFARTYGAPGDNVLDNVDSLASLNHLDAGQGLVPGQILAVPVRNPQLAARLGIGSSSRLVASRS